jgi:hypothetical protein
MCHGRFDRVEGFAEEVPFSVVAREFALLPWGEPFREKC